VVDPHGGGAGIGVMELVRADHAANFITSALRVEARDARPEASDLDQHLGAVLAHEVAIAGREIILPDVERDRGADMALPPRIVAHPAAGQQVELEARGYLPAGAGAAPWEHGAAAAAASRGTPRLIEPAIPIGEPRT